VRPRGPIRQRRLDRTLVTTNPLAGVRSALALFRGGASVRIAQVAARRRKPVDPVVTARVTRQSGHEQRTERTLRPRPTATEQSANGRHAERLPVGEFEQDPLRVLGHGSTVGGIIQQQRGDEAGGRARLFSPRGPVLVLALTKRGFGKLPGSSSVSPPTPLASKALLQITQWTLAMIFTGPSFLGIDPPRVPASGS